MMRRGVACLIVAVLLTACASVNLSRELERTIPRATEQERREAVTDRAKEAVARAEMEALTQRFEALAGRTADERIASPGTAGQPADKERAKRQPPLPEDLRAHPVMQAYVAALGKAIPASPESKARTLTDEMKLPEPSVTAAHALSFAKALRRFLNPDFSRARTARSENPDFNAYLGKYFEAYTDGKFVDGFGGKLAKPKFNNGIGNDTIVGIETVFLELLADWLYQTPLLKNEKGQYVIADPNATPTAASTGLRPTKTLIAVGLSEGEVRGLRCAASIAGDGGLLLAGSIIRTFGGLNAGPALVLGKVSIGDNQTAAKLIETAFEVSFRRGLEHSGYTMLTQRTRADKTESRVPCLLGLL